MAVVVTQMAGALALLGVAGFVGSAVARTRRGQARTFRFASAALAGAGLLLILASLFGWAGAELYVGLAMLVFATGSALAPASPLTRDPAQRAEP